MKKIVMAIIIYMIWSNLFNGTRDSDISKLTSNYTISDVLSDFKDYTQTSDEDSYEDRETQQVYEDEINDYYEEPDEVSGAERMKELEDLYYGICVVDAEFDSDKTYEALCMAVEEHEDSIVIYRGLEYVVSDVQRFRVMSDYSYFWCDGWSYSTYDDYIAVYFDYLFNSYEAERIEEQIDSIYRDIQYEVTESTDGSPWSAAEYVYDYLVREVTFDEYYGPNIRNIYGALIEKRAVCAGYTAAFDYIMSRMGYGVGVAGNTNHIWNYMYWDSEDCFIDVTWGDPDAWDAYGNHYVDYSFMGLDYYELQELDSHAIEYAYISGRGYDNIDVEYDYYYGSYVGNYCDVCGFTAYSYSYDTVRDILYRQFYNNNNSLIVKFGDSNELFTAINELLNNNCETLNCILGDIGYYGYYSYSYDEACNTFVLYLNTQ